MVSWADYEERLRAMEHDITYENIGTEVHGVDLLVRLELARIALRRAFERLGEVTSFEPIRGSTPGPVGSA